MIESKSILECYYETTGYLMRNACLAQSYLFSVLFLTETKQFSLIPSIMRWGLSPRLKTKKPAS